MIHIPGRDPCPSPIRGSALITACVLAIGALGGCGAGAQAAAAAPGAATADAVDRPPPTRKGDVVDTYHGQTIADPYRWLEDPDSAESRAWITAQNAATTAHLGTIAARQGIHDRLEAMWSYDRRSPRITKGGSFFQLQQSGLQNQPVLVVGAIGSDQTRVLLDANTLAADGTVALKDAEPNRTGTMVAWMTSSAGSDWSEIRVRDVASGKDTSDHIRWVKFSGVAWSQDGTGFYYSAYDPPADGTSLTAVNEHQRLYFHRLGTAQAADVLVAQSKEHKDWGFGGGVSDDGSLLIVPIWRGATKQNALRIGRLPPLANNQGLRSDGKAGPMARRFGGGAPTTWIEVDTSFEFALDVIGNVGDTLIVRTDAQAPKGRIVAIDLRKPERANWTTLVAEGSETLEGATIVGKRLVLNLLRDATSVLRVHELDGKLVGEIALPTVGTVSNLTGDVDDPELEFSFQSFTWAGATLRVRMADLRVETAWAPTLPFAADAFVAEQHFATSPDGTRVPYFLVRRKDVTANGARPVWLHAYGGFDISMVPSFRVDRLLWVEMGGVYVLANLRGGGEYGSAWHQAGMLDKKQNVFEDFYAVARDLHAKRWATPATTGIAGGSNGGLLVGASITQHPELFGAALPAVGVMDMLRYHRWTIGWAWVPEYGSSDDPKAFAWLRAYSPLHNCKPARYPATLVTTADHDDRVVPAHSFKFAAALQAAQRGPAPIRIRIEEKAGHGAGKPTSKRIDEAADTMAFFVQALGPARFDRLPAPPPR